MKNEGTTTKSVTIRVQINGTVQEVDAGHTVRTLLESLDLHPGMVVVERNREILERAHYDRVSISDGDSLELVHFVGGG